MDDNVLWLSIWLGAMTTFLATIFLITSHSNGVDIRMETLIKEGQDPVAVRCALNPPRSDASCIIYALRGYTNGYMGVD